MPPLGPRLRRRGPLRTSPRAGDVDSGTGEGDYSWVGMNLASGFARLDRMIEKREEYFTYHTQ